MKKVYLGLFTLIIAGSASAQLMNKNLRSAQKIQNIGEVPAKAMHHLEKAVPFWQNHFDVPSDWVISNAGAAGTPPHTMGDWAITTDVNAIPVTALKPAGHTTAANGYALINSDAAGAGQTQNSMIVTAAAIDCSMKPNVSMIFEQSTRHYQELYYVVVSNDGGTTWTDFQVNTSQAVNTNSANPAIAQVNISSVAANQANVKVGFRYVGAYDWFWAVDDVKLVETDNYDLTATGYYWGVEGTWGARLPYYQTPIAQINPIHFAGIVENIGAMAQSDVTFNAAIVSAAYSGISPQGALNPNESDTFDIAATFQPAAAVASFTVTGGTTSGQTDANPLDNAAPALAFETTQTTFARDAQVVQAGSYNQGQGYEMGNIFDITANQTLTGVDVWVASTSTENCQIYGLLYTIDGSGNFVYAAPTALHTVTAGELGTMITLPLTSSYPLLAGNSYLLVVGSYGDGGATDDFVVGTSGISEAQTTFYLDGNENTGTWYYSTSTPMVRMNFNSSLSVTENAANVNVAVYPNPVVGEATIEVNGATASTISVVDLAGKVVYSSNVAEGTSKVSFSTTNFSAGVYTVNVATSAGTVTKKMVVKN
ncbi:T9SS type A sorting domain-containing protein [Fluviicola chungangensis]|uniref:T9SS type A sorting domain-containing protein n=1 Tax=Fluviicola chungangensis TaxID=2597671 RepID=A0A556MIX9_9FLAO|nr:T9SS type A sorting domain-containing protein [Fluviicola chungangensis]TSJ39785.1 T9SS type A sorting domain-containing protein [Fluviicola chungangensis]